MFDNCYRIPKNKFSFRKHRIFLVLILLALTGLVVFWHNPMASLLLPINVFSKISGVSIAQEDGYTNLLLVGLDRREQDQSPGGLNDTMILASLNPERKRIILTSIPRDLWVPLDSNYKEKISSAYGYGSVDKVLQVVSKVTGLPVHYYVFVDFVGFKKGIDIIGGVDIYVERTFDDYHFPVEGKEDAENEADRYEHLHFEQGMQHMDGEMALKYSRSRYAEGPEGSDFARGERQKKVILAAKEKAMSLSTLFNPLKLKELYSLFGSSVDTNLTVSEIQKLYDISQDLPLENVVSVTIDHTSGGGKQLLFTPEDLSPYNGSWVLVPTAGDFSEVQSYLNDLLFKEYSD